MQALMLKILINALNANDLNKSLKIQRLVESIKTHNIPKSCLQEINFKYNNISGLKVKGCEKIYHGNINQKKARVDIIISDIVNFKANYQQKRESLHNDRWVTPSRRYNNPKYLHLKKYSIKYMKQKFIEL